MELALPHVVIRVCAPGVGVDLVSALSLLPVEVSEARDVWEMHRISKERPAVLVVVVDPPDAPGIVSETRADFPGVPILIISDSEPFPEPFAAGHPGQIDTIRSGVPVQDLCWHVLEAVGRAAHRPGIAERPLGPHELQVDPRGRVLTGSRASDVAFDAGLRLRPDDSLMSLLDPLERPAFARALGGMRAGDTRFCATRLLDDRGHRHSVALGMRGVGDERIAILVQPLICGGPVVGRHINNRDPITGLLTRWAMSRELEAGAKASATEPTVVLVTLDNFSSISHSLGHRQTDDVLLAVASAVNQVFPHPAVTSRLMGDTFLAYVGDAAGDEALRRADRLLRLVGDVDVPGFAPRFPLRASIGVAVVPNGDHDLALRLAEAAAGEAREAGGNRAIVAGSEAFTRFQADDLTASIDGGSWEVWLQPVVRIGTGRAAYHEALARFDAGSRRLASRADFFTAGTAEGLLERFDRMMLQRTLEMLESNPDARLAVNVSFETFVSRQFPGSFLERIREVAGGCERIILEIAPRCAAAPEELARPRFETLAAAGVAVAIDDFGSGICRLHYLTQWPLAFVKLDQLVTGYVDDDPLQRDFVRTVVSLCRARGIETVAEYTRSEEQLARLVDDGVDLFQGALFGMPRPAADVLSPPAVLPAGSSRITAGPSAPSPSR